MVPRLWRSPGSFLPPPCVTFPGGGPIGGAGVAPSPAPTLGKPACKIQAHSLTLSVSLLCASVKWGHGVSLGEHVPKCFKWSVFLTKVAVRWPNDLGKCCLTQHHLHSFGNSKAAPWQIPARNRKPCSAFRGGQVEG